MGVTHWPLGKKLQQELMLKTIILWRQNFCLPWLRPPPLQMGGTIHRTAGKSPGTSPAASITACLQGSSSRRYLCCVTRVTSVWTSWRTSGQHCVCDVRTILLSMQGLLGEPNINSALNTHAKFWRNNLLQETYSEQVSLQAPWRDCPACLSPCVVFSFSSGGLSFLWFLCRKPVLVSCAAIVWFLFI